MILRYRVSLQGLKGFARVYLLKSTMSLYDFHKLMRRDMDFPQDQLIQFKALNAEDALLARYAMFDLGFGTVDEISLKETLDKGITTFHYYYDVTNKKFVIVSYEGEVDPGSGMTYPALVETKGPNPIEFETGYVAYEDLPEDQKHHHPDKNAFKDEDEDDDDLLDDEDNDEESSEDGGEDDEDGKEIFDSDEGVF